MLLLMHFDSFSNFFISTESPSQDFVSKAWDSGPSLDLAVLIEDVAAAQLEVIPLTVLLKKRDYVHASLPALGW